MKIEVKETADPKHVAGFVGGVIVGLAAAYGLNQARELYRVSGRRIQKKKRKLAEKWLAEPTKSTEKE